MSIAHSGAPSLIFEISTPIASISTMLTTTLIGASLPTWMQLVLVCLPFGSRFLVFVDSRSI